MTIVAGLALLAACTSPSVDPVLSDGGDLTVASETPVQRRPIEAFQFTREEYATILSARRILQVRCMERYGFTLREAGAPHRPADTLRPQAEVSELFGVADPGNGYGYPETPEQAAADQRDTANRQYLEKLGPASDAYTLAFSGRYKRAADVGIPERLSETVGDDEVYPTGCDGWAWDQIAPDDVSEGVYPLIREIDPWDEAAADPRVAEVASAWSACMAGAGYSYRNPDEIETEDRRNQSEAMGQQSFDEIERQMQHLRDVSAVDSACRTSSGYARVRFDVLVEYDTRAIEQNAAALSEQRASMDAQVRRAAEIVSEAGW